MTSFAQMHNDYLDPDRAGLNDVTPYEMENDWADEGIESIFWHESGEVSARRTDGSEFTIFKDAGTDDVLVVRRKLERYFKNGMGLSRSQRDKLKRIEAALAKAEKAPFKKPIPTFAECWADVEEYIPESGRLGQDEAGDWTPYWCDDCDTWHSTAYAMDIVRKSDVMEGRDCFEIRSVDQDGNWDFDTATYDGDPYWDDFYRTYFRNDDHFKQWCRYHIWCAEHGGIDPLNEFMTAPTIDGHIEAARSSLKYFKMGRKA